MSIEIDLREAVYALSDALDLVGVDEVQHGKRVGFMALECARYLGWDNSDIDTILHAGLLHDCGVSSTRVHKQLIDEMDWVGAQEHCLLGERLLRNFAPLAELAPIVRYHHSHWDALVSAQIDPRVARMANLIYLTDRVDALAAPHYGKDIMQVRDDIRAKVEELAGSLFAPDLIQAFIDISSSEAFWYSLEPRHQELFLRRMERAHHPITIGIEELRQFASIFARIVDAKSEFTWEHSIGVARLARRLGEWSGLSAEQCDKIEIAGLLHDLGKLQVPDEVLEKAGPLTRTERNIINRHSFETYQILSRIHGLEDVALWAAYHHETLDGAGYPFHRRGNQLSIEARIIAVADIFQALSQQRPYRDRVDARDVMHYLQILGKQHHLDREVIAVVAEHVDECRRLATGKTRAAPVIDEDE